jgi:hypothetical protein
MTEVRIIDGLERSNDDPRQELIELLGVILQAMDAWPVRIQDGSRLAADRVATEGSPVDLPTMCEHYIGGSDDFLGGLYQLMRPRPDILQIPRFSLYPLIRAVMESSGQAVWVLGPADPEKRFLRLLQLQRDELKHDGKYIDARYRPRDDDSDAVRSLINEVRRATDPGKRDRWKGLLDAAAAVGIPEADFKGGVRGGYGQIIREAVDEQDIDRDWRGRQGAGVWIFISGLSHPSMSRAWAASIQKPGEVGPDGVMPVWFEAKPSVVRDGLRFAVALHLRAIRLWKEACAAPAPPDDDVAPPPGKNVPPSTADGDS